MHLLLCALGAGFALSASAHGTAPPPPVLPPSFFVLFNESIPAVFGGANNTLNGASWYDAANNRSAEWRSTGKYDRYCGSANSADSPCTHLVVSGQRYLIWPELKSCCLCCKASAGCGILRPDWIGAANGSYIGQQSISTPTFNGLVDVWSAPGLQNNYWYQTLEAEPVALVQVPNDYMYYDSRTYVVGPQPDAVFVVPSYCSGSCPLFSVCTIAD